MSHCLGFECHNQKNSCICGCDKCVESLSDDYQQAHRLQREEEYVNDIERMEAWKDEL